MALSSDHAGFRRTHGSYGYSDERIFFALYGDRVKKGHIPSDCFIKVSHMDIFPSVFEYLRLPIKSEWQLDGKSRLEWSNPLATQTELCNLSKSKAVVTLSGGYMYSQEDGQES